jgi:hypothetical protein
MAIELGTADATLKVGSSDVVEIRQGGVKIFPAPSNPSQFWIVEPCGGGAQSSLQIDFANTLTAGQAVRPVLEPFSTTTLPGYETPICWTLIAPTNTGTYCGIRGPASDCTQSVCL